MSLASLFTGLRARRELGFIPYFTAGYPSVEASLDFIEAAERAGANAIEIGLPFSDPVADGPVIQASSQAALDAGFRPIRFLEALAGRPAKAPRIVMSYLNPLLALGDEGFMRLQRASVEGLVVPDLPLEEAPLLRESAARVGIDLALLAAPTTTAERLALIAREARGFIYAVGVMGPTGARRELDPALPALLARLRAATDLPVAAGFGLSRPEHLAALTGLADAAIVGSRLVAAIRDGEDLKSLLQSFKSSTTPSLQESRC